MKRIIVILVIIGFSLPTRIAAQSYEELFNDFVQQSQQMFKEFSDSVNRQFAEAMAANMRTYNGELPKVKDPKPMPDKLPEVNKDNIPKLPIVKPLLQPKQPQTNPIDVEPVSQESVPVYSPLDQYDFLNFNLFGDNIRMIKKPFPERLKGLAVEDVSDFWIQLSECDYKDMLQRCQIAREQKGFNDWAIYQLVLRMAQQVYDHQYNEQVVMAVFLLNQLGLEAKVGFAKTHLFCLIAVEQQLYGISFVDIDDFRYYFFEIDPYYINKKTLLFRTYHLQYPNETQSLDMNIRKPLKNEFSSPEEENEILMNMNMIELFKTYPTVDIEVYANASPSETFCQSVDRSLRPYIQTQSTYEAVSFLLSFMHHSFKYATDEEQFGYEKTFFCEENFYYPYNDCEDRSVLFVFLVRHLLNLDVVLIDYPGHIATAVHFPTEVEGESVIYNGKRYVICDPTYLGASVGMEMSTYKPSDRKVIPVGK